MLNEGRLIRMLKIFIVCYIFNLSFLSPFAHSPLSFTYRSECAKTALLGKNGRKITKKIPHTQEYMGKIICLFYICKLDPTKSVFLVLIFL